jgi:hypothetical protein
LPTSLPKSKITLETRFLFCRSQLTQKPGAQMRAKHSGNKFIVFSHNLSAGMLRPYTKTKPKNRA